MSLVQRDIAKHGYAHLPKEGKKNGGAPALSRENLSREKFIVTY